MYIPYQCTNLASGKGVLSCILCLRTHAPDFWGPCSSALASWVGRHWLGTFLVGTCACGPSLPASLGVGVGMLLNGVALHGLAHSLPSFPLTCPVSAWATARGHEVPNPLCTPIRASFSQRLGGDLPAPLLHEGTQPPRVQGMHYGFLLSLELERVLPIRPNEEKLGTKPIV